jgi:hypothetical protein
VYRVDVLSNTRGILKKWYKSIPCDVGSNFVGRLLVLRIRGEGFESCVTLSWDQKFESHEALFSTDNLLLHFWVLVSYEIVLITTAQTIPTTTYILLVIHWTIVGNTWINLLRNHIQWKIQRDMSLFTDVITTLFQCMLEIYQNYNYT